MPDITVHRHGDRWAVRDASAHSPTSEHATREAAELAARDLAAGGRIEVREDDPSGLDRVQAPNADQAPGEGEPEIDAVKARERARSVQTGL
jgi:hypothetical protein